MVVVKNDDESHGIESVTKVTEQKQRLLLVCIGACLSSSHPWCKEVGHAKEVVLHSRDRFLAAILTSFF